MHETTKATIQVEKILWKEGVGPLRPINPKNRN